MESLLLQPRWTFRRFFDRSREVLRDEGLRGYLFRVLGRGLYRRVFVLERLSSEPIPAIEAQVPLTFGLLDNDELNEYLDFRPDKPGTLIRRRRELGEVCFVARHEGTIVGESWASHGSARIPYLRQELPLARDEVYRFGNFTAPSFRGLGIAPALSGWILQRSERQGVRREVAVVLPENRASLKAMAKTGYRVTRMIGWVKLGRWTWHFERAVPRCTRQ